MQLFRDSVLGLTIRLLLAAGTFLIVPVTVGESNLYVCVFALPELTTTAVLNMLLQGFFSSLSHIPSKEPGQTSPSSHH